MTEIFDAAAVQYRVDVGNQFPTPTDSAIWNAHRTGVELARSWSSYPLGECDHALRIDSEVAGWTTSVCVRCGDASPGQCTHPAGFEWVRDGRLLRCRTCGVDGT